MTDDVMAQVQPVSPEKKNYVAESPLCLKKRRVAVVLLALLIWSVLGAGVCLWSYAVLPLDSGAIGKIQVYIPAQSNFSHIKKILAGAQLIPDDLRFVLLARLMGVAHQLKAGEYVFDFNQSPYSILKDLEAGKTVLRAIGFAEGYTIFQIAEIVEQGGWGSREDFLFLMQDSAFIKDLGVSSLSLEGYLFPETYFFERGESLRKIVKVMVQRTQKVFAEECLQAEAVEGFYFDCAFAGVGGEEVKGQKEKDLRLDAHQLLTLASIVEKETGVPAERPLVAKVFLNRLRRGMKLQADPTVIYGLRKFGESLTTNDLKAPTPFNTYAVKGLPQGPICNPGRASIAALFKPAAEDYLYFVSENNGGHYFSKNLREHNRAVARFRKKRSVE